MSAEALKTADILDAFMALPDMTPAAADDPDDGLDDLDEDALYELLRSRLGEDLS